MVLVVADIHLGRTDPESEREKEVDLIRCLESIRSDSDISTIVLLGDIFDAFIEYPTLIPKGYSRFLGMLAAWADSGVKIHYLAGNHDPWHINYFKSEFGATFHENELDLTIGPYRVRCVHGDGIAPGLYRRLKPWLRHPLPVALYKTLLPADLGFRLARWVNDRFSAKERDEQTVALVREHGANQVQAGFADIFVAGHTHHAELTHVANGSYLNVGSWHYERTFALFDRDGVKLLEYRGGKILEIPSNRYSGTH